MRLFLLLVWAAACGNAAAQPFLRTDAHNLRLAAELVVIAGDVRRLTTETPAPVERQGLKNRIAGALSSLPLLLRRAGGDPALASRLRSQLEHQRWLLMARGLAELKQSHPFKPETLIRRPATPALLAQGESIHKAACAACHEAPGSMDTLLPAKHLSRQLNSMSREEFAARLVLGVRGDKSTALANPFSDVELAALIAWYAHTGD